MEQQIKFTKMHGLGNDFMVIDAINQQIDLNETLIQKWSDRYFGLGFDQLLLVEESNKADFKYRIFNADGSEVEQCGNGARCFAKYVFDKGLTNQIEIEVETLSGIITLLLVGDDQVQVNMGLPNFSPQSLPFNFAVEQDIYSIDIDLGRSQMDSVNIGAVSVGNPHAVLIVDDIEHAPVSEWGEKIESHSLFPERVNVGFAQIVSDSQINLRVYERGAAETLACGTGACAAMVVLKKRQLLQSDVVTVSLPGGDLIIEWNGNIDSPIMMTGPAESVFDGVIDFE